MADIFVIDDDPGTRETLKDILGGWGYPVQVFEKGQEAVAAFEKSPVAVLLADVRLPDLSGLEVMRSAREINPDVGVIIMTGHASVESAVQAVNQGANAYITKPIHMEELQAILKKAFREVRLSQENKRLIDSLQISNRSLEVAKEEYRNANEGLAALAREMEDLLHVVSHDLKSPMINIQGFAGRLEEDFVSLREKFRKLLPRTGEEVRGEISAALSDFEKSGTASFQFIRKGIQKMDTMIQSLLQLSRVGRIADPFEENDLNAMAADIRDVFFHQCRSGNIRLIFHPLPTVNCRRNEINQVFSNLIANAIQYMGDSPVREIEISCVPQGGTFQFSVRDTGIGIDEKNFEKIFRMFARLQEVPGAGEGIGLALVQKIVRSHGGRIWVESLKGKGSAFFFTLPGGNDHGTRPAG